MRCLQHLNLIEHASIVIGNSSILIFLSDIKILNVGLMVSHQNSMSSQLFLFDYLLHSLCIKNSRLCLSSECIFFYEFLDHTLHQYTIYSKVLDHKTFQVRSKKKSWNGWLSLWCYILMGLLSKNGKWLTDGRLKKNPSCISTQSRMIKILYIYMNHSYITTPSNLHRTYTYIEP